MWMLLVLFYGLVKGVREICKKKALETNSVIEVLLVYTFLSFILVIPQAPKAMGLTATQYFWVAVKPFIIFVAWIAGFKAIKHLPISMYGILDLSRVLFASLLGVVVLHETITLHKSIGLVLVCGGLLFLKVNPDRLLKKGKKNDTGTPVAESSEKGNHAAIAAPAEKIVSPLKLQSRESTTWFVFLAFLSCILNACSGLMDKILMRDMNSSQLQFWYTGFMVVYYAIYALVTRTKINRSIWKNVWVWLLAAGLIAMDKVLFIANGMPESQITVMTLIKQSSVIVAILAGKFVFHEKNILHKVICAAIIITGIVIGVC